jgi:hypothetical protein
MSEFIWVCEDCEGIVRSAEEAKICLICDCETFYKYKFVE